VRVLVVSKYMPGEDGSVGGLSAYFISRYTADYEQLVLTKAVPVRAREIGPHAKIEGLGYHDIHFSSKLRNELLSHKRPGIAGRIKVFSRALLKLSEVTFIVKCIPHMIRFRPNIVHCHGSVMMFPGVVAAWLSRSKFVLTIHGLFECEHFKRWSFLRCFLRAAHRIHCVSENIAVEIAPFVEPGRTVVIPNGVDTGLFRDMNRNREERIIAIGTFRWFKGFEYLVEAMAMFHKVLPAYKLTIAGDGIERQALIDRVKELGLDDVVSLPGMMKQESVVEELNRSRLFVMSSIFEGHPRVLVEAVACGTPAVITTACSGEGIIEQAGIAVEPRDPRALCDAMSKMLTDETLWKKCREGCGMVAYKYDWRVLGGRMSAVYDSLLDRP
jgi:glycosyltransferase involved in cell wall biosynthesis